VSVKKEIVSSRRDKSQESSGQISCLGKSKCQGRMEVCDAEQSNSVSRGCCGDSISPGRNLLSSVVVATNPNLKSLAEKNLNGSVHSLAGKKHDICRLSKHRHIDRIIQGLEPTMQGLKKTRRGGGLDDRRRLHLI
jgi:hypothetical protein